MFRGATVDWSRRRSRTFPSETLTVLPVQQNLETVGLVVVECLPHLLDGLLVCQFSVHETETGKEEKSYW